MWDTKYRPLKFEDVLGQPGTVQVLKARLANGTALDRNYLFAGNFGLGKTTLARILARALLCQNRDPQTQEPCNECENCKDILNGASLAYVEQDAASGGTIDRVRSIVEDLPFSVHNAPKKVYTFDEAHRMSKDAQDVLLKPLEEKQLVGIFCTTELDKIRGAIRSRCDEFTLRKVTREDVLERMRKILTAEGVVFEDEAVLIVIDYSGSHVRDVVSRLEMVAQMGDVTVGNVRDYLHLSVVTLYYEAWLALGDPQQALSLVERACDQVPPDEVAAGLAEAAMNSYRLASGLHADFTYIDRGLAQQVYGQYQEACIALAQWFLRTRSPSKVGLLCDVLNCAKGVPKDSSVTEAAPVQVVVSVPTGAPPTPQVTVPQPILAQTLPVPVPVPVPVPAQELPGGGRGDNPYVPRTSPVIGNLGSGDPAAVSKNDTRVITPGFLPKPQTRPVTVQEVTEPDGTLTPAVWRREFDQRWKAQRS